MGTRDASYQKCEIAKCYGLRRPLLPLRRRQQGFNEHEQPMRGRLWIVDEDDDPRPFFEAASNKARPHPIAAHGLVEDFHRWAAKPYAKFRYGPRWQTDRCGDRNYQCRRLCCSPYEYCLQVPYHSLGNTVEPQTGKRLVRRAGRQSPRGECPEGSSRLCIRR
jgi:hypothetical protein